MNDAEFQDHIDRFGDDVRLWPAAVQADAERLLAASPGARGCLAQARDIRLTLSAPALVRAPKSLKDSIFAAAFGERARTVPSLTRKAKERHGSAVRS